MKNITLILLIIIVYQSQANTVKLPTTTWVLFSIAMVLNIAVSLIKLIRRHRNRNEPY